MKAPYRFVPQGSKFAQLERGVPTGKTYASFEAARSETLRLNDAWRASHGKRKNPSWESEMALHPHMLIDYDKRIGKSSAPMSRAEFDAYLASLKEEKEEKAAPRASASLPEDYEKLWAAQYAFAPHLNVRNPSRRRNSNGERLARETEDLAAAEKELAFLLPLEGKAPQFDERIEYLRDIIAGLRGDILLSKREMKQNPSRRRNLAQGNQMPQTIVRRNTEQKYVVTVDSGFSQTGYEGERYYSFETTEAGLSKILAEEWPSFREQHADFLKDLRTKGEARLGGRWSFIAAHAKKSNPVRRRNYAETPTLFWHDDKSYFDGEGRDQIATSGSYTLRIWQYPGERLFHVQREEPGMKAYPVGERTTLTAAKELAQRHLEDMLRAFPNRRNPKSRR